MIFVLFIGVLVVGVFPTRTWLTQRSATAQSESELRQLKAERVTVQREAKGLQSGAEIERRAREDLGYVKPGEQAYAILPGQSDPTGLPNQWPFVGVERVLSAG